MNGLLQEIQPVPSQDQENYAASNMRKPIDFCRFLVIKKEQRKMHYSLVEFFSNNYDLLFLKALK